MITLAIEQRDMKHKPDTLRKGGKIPGVVYGPKEAATPITIDKMAFDKVWRTAGESSIVVLEGVGESKETLIHDVAFHPVTDAPLHVDFYAIEKGKRVQTHVPISFIGESPAVEKLSANLLKVMHEIEIEAMPKDLPHELSADLSLLVAYGDTITVKDISIPAGVTVINSMDDIVASVSEAKEEVIDEPVAAIDMEAIEVEQKGKKEEEGAEGDAAPTEEVSKEEKEKK
ncbi:MAG: 50S ribosomal protein L25 [Patescibacteria group bacterium]